MGQRRVGLSRNMYRGSMDKDKSEGRNVCGKGGLVGWGKVIGGKWGQL